MVLENHSRKISANKIKEKGGSRYIIKLDEACFQEDIAYGGLRDLNRAAATDKVLRDKAWA